ncbi:hypothetical protein P171DRAFT_478233 [Karstenula rhodostoma CBS 690.94]|uniref:Uncharacterized protein n=1 Tax=Karstenula rhodostoma CBS 690.94 TaxID=1392251 RepID=A0A9P4UJC1_9PLEO|nr:hypothetical protein P171DRAFT_478233 [Karstenula rhodostoma CBS 690.94]
MAAALSLEAQQLLDTLSTAFPTSTGIDQSAALSEIESNSIVDEFWAGPWDAVVPVGFPNPDFQKANKAPFLRMHGCHIVDESDCPRQTMVGFVAEWGHGILTLIHPEGDDMTHNATYNVINTPDEYSRMQLTGIFAPLILADRARDISAWILDPASVRRGWRCLAIFIEYVFLTQNVPSLLLNWGIQEKSTRLREAFERVANGREMQRPIQGQESFLKKRKWSDATNENSNSKQRISKMSGLDAVQVKKRSGGKPHLLVMVPVPPAQLAQVTRITHPK